MEDWVCNSPVPAYLTILFKFITAKFEFRCNKDGEIPDLMVAQAAQARYCDSSYLAT